jgi:two-component system, LuxR family, sensor kinase FixL
MISQGRRESLTTETFERRDPSTPSFPDVLSFSRGSVGGEDQLAEQKRFEMVALVQFHLGKVLGQTTDLSTCMRQVLETICRLDGLDCGGTYEFTPETGAVSLLAHYGLSEAFVSEAAEYGPETPEAQIVQCGEVLHSAYSTQRVADGCVVREGLRAILVVPIVHQGKILGSMHLASKTLDELPLILQMAVETAAYRLGQVWVRLKTERSLALAQRNLQAVFHTMDDLLFIFDASGQLIQTNPAFEATLGYSPNEQATMTVHGLYPPEYANLLADALSEVLARTSKTLELPMLRKDGSRLWFETHFRRGSWDGTEALFGVARDITTRRQMEASLREREERLSLVLQATGDGIWDCNLVTHRMWTNEAHIRLYGRLPSHELGVGWQWWVSRIHSDDRERISAEVDAAMTGQQTVYQLQYRFLRRDGDWAVISDRATIIRSKSGEPLRVLGIMQDVTAEKEADARLHALQMQVAHLERLTAMGELVAGIAHEVNQPLFSIQNYANACRNMLETAPPGLEDVRQWVENIAEAAQRGGQIIHRLRGFLSRPNVDYKPALLQDVIKESLTLVSLDSRRRRTSIQLNLAAEACPIAIDRVQIQQVLVNLIKNAFDAMEENTEGSRHLTIGTEQQEGLIQVSIADNGSGISRELDQHIFEPFHTTKPDGLGMGLVVSSRIIQSHGGRIWFTHNPVKGTTFHFTLPTQRTGLPRDSHP